MERFLAAIGRIKPVDHCLFQNANGALKRSLTLVDLIAYGVGCSVGAGVYSLVGVGAEITGPGISLSFLISGIACIFTSLTYSEFAARVPITGSAYTFVYLTFGELAAWLIGWNLTLGYGISAAGIARSWASYAESFLLQFGLQIPHWLVRTELLGMSCSVLASVLVLTCTFILLAGVHESAKFNACVTLLNITVLLFVIVLGSTQVEPTNWQPFAPQGFDGIMTGAGVVFFAYLGFDMVACLAEEVQEPQRTLPKGIIGSLLISMTIYVGVSLVVTGMAPVSVLGGEIPLINAFTYHDLAWAGRIVSFGSIFGLTTAAFTCLMGQPRIFYQMAKDGLLPEIFARLHPTTHVPVASTIFTGVLVSAISFVFDLDFLANVISCGTLQVFTFVNAGVLLLRMKPSRHQTGSVAVRVVVFTSAAFAVAFSLVLKWHWVLQALLSVVLLGAFVSIQSLDKTRYVRISWESSSWISDRELTFRLLGQCGHFLVPVSARTAGAVRRDCRQHLHDGQSISRSLMPGGTPSRRKRNSTRATRSQHERCDRRVAAHTGVLADARTSESVSVIGSQRGELERAVQVFGLISKNASERGVELSEQLTERTLLCYLDACTGLASTCSTTDPSSMISQRLDDVKCQLETWRRERGYKVTSAVLQRLLYGYDAVNQWRTAVAILKNASNVYGVAPGVGMFQAVMEICNRAEQHKAAEQIFGAMQKQQTSHDGRVYTSAACYVEAIYALLEQQANWIQATQLFMEMQKLCPAEELHPSLLNLIASHSNDRRGNAVMPVISVGMTPSRSVMRFKRAVKHEDADIHLKGIAAHELLVFANRAAFDAKDVEPLDDDASIETLGMTKQDPLVVQPDPPLRELPPPTVLPDQDAFKLECGSLAEWTTGTTHEIPLIHAFMANLGGCTNQGTIYWRQEDADVASILLTGWLEPSTEEKPNRFWRKKSILEGSPGSGKSTLLCLLAFYVVLHHHKSVLLYRRVAGETQETTYSLLYLSYDRALSHVVFATITQCEPTRAAAVYRELIERHSIENTWLMLDGFAYVDIPSGLETFKLLATSQLADLKSLESTHAFCVLHPCWKQNDLARLAASVYGWTDDQVEERFFYSGGSVADFTRASLADLQAAMADAVRKVDGPVRYLANDATARQLGPLLRRYVRAHISAEYLRFAAVGEERSLADRYTRGWWHTHVIDSEFAVRALWRWLDGGMGRHVVDADGEGETTPLPTYMDSKRG